ncbi:MAG: histidine kinase [Saprospiraceae bacterium]
MKLFRNTKDILGFDDRWFVFHGILIVSFGINMMMFGITLKDDLMSLFTGCYLISILYTALFWYFLRLIHLYVVEHHPGYDNLKNRYTWLIPITIAAFVVIKLILDFLLDPLLHKYLPLGTEPNPIIENLGSFLFLVLIISIYEGLYLFSELKKSKIDQEMLIKENISSQLEGLKNQVNPHFLFNSLNTLASIIPEDSERGVRFVTKLSKVYRYILDIKDQKLITLAKELDYLIAYSYLLKERFGNNVDFDIQITDSDKRKLIIPLSLQITFENAIKHNIITTKNPLKIEVFVIKDKLIVKNNLQLKSLSDVSTKTGLQNIKTRYSFFTDQVVDVMQTDKYFEVRLPLLKNDAKV